MNLLKREYPKIGRINRKVLVVVSIIICVLFFIAFLRGISKKSKVSQNAEDRRSTVSTYNDWIPEKLSYSDVLKETSLPGHGLGQSKDTEINSLRKELEALKRQTEKLQGKHSDIIKGPPVKRNKGIDKAKKYEQEALNSPIFFSNKTEKSALASVGSMGSEADKLTQGLTTLKRAAAISNMPNLADIDFPGFGESDSFFSQNNQKEKREFLEKTLKPDEVYNKDKLHIPISPYELKAGSAIPCTLITGLNSDLPGSIAAQVRETVYDTVNGEHVLIPQGSRMIGNYDSIITYGQERTLIVFNRIIMPNGNSISLEQFQGMDLQGYAGLKDKVNNHWFRILGSVVVAGILQGLADRTEEIDELGLDDTEIVANSVSAEVAKTAAEIINKQINIQPTLEVRPGWNFNVFVEKDLILEAYKG